MTRDDPQLEPWLHALRDPLSRVELAASQIVRLEATPAVHALATSIRAAVGDLDARIHEMIAASCAGTRGGRGEQDCRTVVTAVLERVEPVLVARACALGAASVPAEPVLGDPVLARRASLRLLRGAAAWAGAGGSIRPALLAEAGRTGVRVEAARAFDAAPATGDAFAAARRFALAEGVEFTFDSGAGRQDAVATLWLPRGDA